MPWLILWRLIRFSTCICTSFATVSNNHLASSNTHLFSYNSGSQKSEVSLTGFTSKCWQCWVLLEALGRESSSLPFPVSGGLIHSLTHNPFLESLQPLASMVTSLSYSSVVKSPLPPFHKAI